MWIRDRSDTAKGWLLEAKGRYVRAEPAKDEQPLRSQLRFMEFARERARDTDKGVSRQLAPAPMPTAQATMDKLRKRAGKKRRKAKRRPED